MYCPNCGSSYDNVKMLFCENCGCSLSTDNAQTFIGPPVNIEDPKESLSFGSPASLTSQANLRGVSNDPEPVGHSIIRTITSSRLFLTAVISSTFSIIFYPIMLLLHRMSAYPSESSDIYNEISGMIFGTDRYTLVFLIASALIISIPGILTAIAEWMLFVSSKKSRRQQLMTTGLTILKVLSIIKLVMCVLFVVLEIISLIMVMLSGSYDFAMFSAVFGAVLLNLLLAGALFLYFWKSFKMVESTQRMAITGNLEAKASTYVAVFIMLSNIFPLSLIIAGSPLLKIFGLAGGISATCFSLVIFRFHNVMEEVKKTSAMTMTGQTASVNNPVFNTTAENILSSSTGSTSANNTISYVDNSSSADRAHEDIFFGKPSLSGTQADTPARNSSYSSSYSAEEEFSTTPIRRRRQGSLSPAQTSPDTEAEQFAREEAERLVREQAERERIERERQEAERLAREQAERERIERERQEAERLAREQAVEQEQIEALQSERNITSLLDTSLLQHTAELVRQSSGDRITINTDRFRIGRNLREVDYYISDNPAIGRHHADIICRSGSYFIVDLNSTNHVYLNGVMLPPGMEVPVSDFSEIRLADEAFSFRIK